jgi:tellurite resistance protein TehA-like permease
VHGEAPAEKQRRTIGATAAQALETAVVPVLVIGLSATGIWPLRTGLVLAAAGLVLTLVVVALIAVRRSTLSTGKRILVVAGELALGLVVVAIKLLAH